MATDDLGLPAKFLVHNNDTKFTRQFDDLFESAGTEVVKTAIAAPNQQAHIERGIQILKFECLDAFVVVAERHLNHLCKQFQLWFNGERPHSARDHLPPGWDPPPKLAEEVDSKNIVCTTRLGGHLTSYSRRAAQTRSQIQFWFAQLRSRCAANSIKRWLAPQLANLTAHKITLPLDGLRI